MSRDFFPDGTVEPTLAPTQEAKHTSRTGVPMNLPTYVANIAVVIYVVIVIALTVLATTGVIG